MFKIKPTLRTRIYLSMLALVFISLITIGAVTIIHFNNQNEEYHAERLKRKENTLVKSLEFYFGSSAFSGDINVVSRTFEEEITKLAEINNIKINIYNLDGYILMSSDYDYADPDFYTQRIDEEIRTNLLETKERQVEQISKTEISAYSLVKGKDKKTPVAIINIPYDEKNSPQSEDLRSYLTTLIEVYIFLLLGAAIIAFLLSNYITRGIRAIADKLKSVKINQKNEPLVWSGNDEISTLVKQYNSMIEELEESASQLAKSEREHAWREMAKQVAHEIKNPLTPMKLSVQHLERALRPDDPDYQEKLSRFSVKLITQIDALTSIANEFSNFAKMPKSKMQEIDIRKVLIDASDLFKEHDSITIKIQDEINECLFIQGDSEQLTRVFNNIIKNAIQAMPENHEGIIDVKIRKDNSFCYIDVKDNGTGIPDEIVEKIFVPNFTTKTSGSGLGLAMVKQIINAHNGSVDFTTQKDKGTVFYLKLPL